MTKPKQPPWKGRQPYRSEMVSKRAFVFYLERARVVRKADRVVYFVASGRNESGYQIPDANTAFILLGKGSSITDGAIRLLAESNVMVGFCGTGGTPLFAATEPVFMPASDEYRPTEYAQKWMRMWLDDDKRLQAAKNMTHERLRVGQELWKIQNLEIPPDHLARTALAIDQANSTEKLMGVEATWVKGLYKFLAGKHRIDFRREHETGRGASSHSWINALLNHGNYLGYGYAAAVLHVLGIPFSLPVLHGKTRRGALVFDVADMIKDGLVLPLAFKMGTLFKSDQEYRERVVELAFQTKSMDTMIDIIKNTIDKSETNQTLTYNLKNEAEH